MIFLDIVNRISKLSGMQGRVNSTVNNNTYQSTLIEIAKVAWTDIQTKRKDWYFLEASTSFYIDENGEDYPVDTALGAPGQRFSHWDKDRVYWVNKKLRYYTNDWYYRKNVDNTTRINPDYFTVQNKDNTLSFNKVDGQYPITANYYKSAQELYLDTDVPDMPDEYHNIIVYKAISEMGSLIGTGNLIQRYEQKYASMFGDLMRAQLPSKDLKRRSIA